MSNNSVGQAQIDVNRLRVAIENYQAAFAVEVVKRNVQEEKYQSEVTRYEALPWYKRLFTCYPVFHNYFSLWEFEQANWQYEGVKTLANSGSRLVTLNDSAVAWVLRYEVTIA